MGARLHANTGYAAFTQDRMERARLKRHTMVHCTTNIGGARMSEDRSKPELGLRGVAIIGAAFGAVAVGAFAVGAFAIGALAIRRLAIQSVAVGRARLKSLEVDELTVKQLRAGDVTVTGSLELPESKR